jgi:hypothetical protein
LRASDANHAALNLRTNPKGALHGHGLANRCDSLCFPERVRIQTLQAVSTETRNEPSRSLEPRTEPRDRPTAAVYENSTCVDSPSDRMTPLNHYLKRLNLGYVWHPPWRAAQTKCQLFRSFTCVRFQFSFFHELTHSSTCMFSHAGHNVNVMEG